MAVKNSENLWGFLIHIKNSEYGDAKKLLKKARNDLEYIFQHLNLDSGKRKRLQGIQECLTHVEKGHFQYAYGKCVSAEAAFKEVIEPFWKEEERRQNKQKVNAETPKVSVPGNYRDGGRVMAPVYDASADVQSRKERADDPRGQVQKNIGKVQRVVDKPDVNQMHPIVREFYNLYEGGDTPWFDAHDELQSKGMDERQISKLLLQIVEASYQLCEKEVDVMIKGLTDVAIKLLQGKHSTALKEKPKGDVSLLKYYLQCKSDKITPSIGQEVLKSYRKDVLKRFSRLPELSKFAEKVTSLTWQMVTQDPPIRLDTRTCQFDMMLHNPLTQRGAHVDYVVWPALLQKSGHTEEVLLKGRVECK